MRLETLSLREWRVFAALDLDFSDGLIGIRGPNGAGKTTLAEAIGWALFGKLRERARVADLRRQGAPEGARSSVTLSWRIGDVRYRVERVVNGSARLWIDSTLETSQTTATNLRIAQELNMTWDLFCRTVYARQKDVAALDPGATGEARRMHVERLLGLGRVRDAAAKAREEHKRLKAGLEGMRSAVVDVGELRARLDDASRRAMDTPAIAAADAAVAEARAAFDVARRAAAAEAVRASQHAALEPRVAPLSRAVADAEARVSAARRRGAERAEALAVVGRIASSAAGAPEAEGLRRRWQALSEAAEAEAAASEALAALRFDAAADASRTVALADLRAELEALVVPDGLPALQSRLAALEAIAEAGPVDAAEAAERSASEAADAAERAVAAVGTRLAGEREHLAASSGEDAASCPVCLRPFEGPREELVAEHERRIARLEAELASAEHDRWAARSALEAARDAHARAARAAAALEAATHAVAARDETPRATVALDAPPRESALDAAREELGRVLRAREHALARQFELRGSLAELEAAARAAAEARARHGRLTATVAARHEDVERRSRDLGVTRYDRHAHLSATEEAARLVALQEELVKAHAVVAASVEVAAEEEAALGQLEERRAELSAVRSELSALAFDPGAAAQLAAAERDAEARWDALREAASRLRVAAAAASAEVAGLQEQLAAAEQLEREIAAAELSLREHAVAHAVLVEYRDAQTKRAWPALEQTAGALLAQATDGRYADVRLSGEDFRLVIADRGEEHPFDRFSGGEQDLANLCVRLAIADWIARERDVELGFVVLDEVFGSQDDDRRRGLITELRRLSERFHQMLVITHVPEIADQCDSVIALEQPELGSSRIAA